MVMLMATAVASRFARGRLVLGWKPARDVGFRTRITKKTRLEAVQYGREELFHAKEFGERHAEVVLDHQADMLLKEWRDFYLVFPGTVWLMGKNEEAILYLYWEPLTGRWLHAYGPRGKILSDPRSRVLQIVA